jgi:hypothetical protein
MPLDPDRFDADEAVVDEHPYLKMLRGDLGLGLRLYAVGGSLLLVFLCAMGIFALAS